MSVERARTTAVAHWERTGSILPGTAGEIARHRSRLLAEAEADD